MTIKSNYKNVQNKLWENYAKWFIELNKKDISKEIVFQWGVIIRIITTTTTTTTTTIIIKSNYKNVQNKLWDNYAKWFIELKKKIFQKK